MLGKSASPDKSDETETSTFVDLCLFSGQVISTESLISPAEDEDPLCQSLPVSACQAAVFIPTQPARLALILSEQLQNNKVLSVFDIRLKKTKYKSEIQGEDLSRCVQVGFDTFQMESYSVDLILAL